jgi:hypothetical protein
MGGVVSSRNESSRVVPTVCWPCANCQSMVSGCDKHCPTCHGRQAAVLITKQPNKLWLKRVGTPSPVTTTALLGTTTTASAISVAESDGLRPVDPVAVTLASAPSPTQSPKRKSTPPPPPPLFESGMNTSGAKKARVAVLASSYTE